jgi:thiamine pyrophosphate-dependent acetolactate synthase large subunit-like protein
VHKNVHVDVPLVGDLKTVLTDLIPMVDEYEHDAWMEQINSWQTEARSAIFCPGPTMASSTYR